MAKDYELLRAIEKVEEDAKRQVAYHREALREKSIWRGEEWKSAEYHQSHIDQLEQVLNYLFIRSMQIDPD